MVDILPQLYTRTSLVDQISKRENKWANDLYGHEIFVSFHVLVSGMKKGSTITRRAHKYCSNCGTEDHETCSRRRKLICNKFNAPSKNPDFTTLMPSYGSQNHLRTERGKMRMKEETMKFQWLMISQRFFAGLFNQGLLFLKKLKL